MPAYFVPASKSSPPRPPAGEADLFIVCFMGGNNSSVGVGVGLEIGGTSGKAGAAVFIVVLGESTRFIEIFMPANLVPASKSSPGGGGEADLFIVCFLAEGLSSSGGPVIGGRSSGNGTAAAVFIVVLGESARFIEIFMPANLVSASKPPGEADLFRVCFIEEGLSSGGPVIGGTSSGNGTAAAVFIVVLGESTRFIDIFMPAYLVPASKSSPPGEADLFMVVFIDEAPGNSSFSTTTADETGRPSMSTRLNSATFLPFTPFAPAPPTLDLASDLITSGTAAFLPLPLAPALGLAFALALGLAFALALGLAFALGLALGLRFFFPPEGSGSSSVLAKGGGNIGISSEDTVDMPS